MPEPKRLGEFSPEFAKDELGLIDQVRTKRKDELSDYIATERPQLKRPDDTPNELDLVRQVMSGRKKEAPVAKERGVLGELIAGFGRGALGVVAAPAEIADVAGEAIGWEALEKAGESGVKAVEKYIEESPKLKRTESISKNILKNPELWKDPRWYSSIVGEGLPTILSMVVPGMAAAKAAKVTKLGARGVRAARIAGGLSAGVGLEAAGAASDIRHHEEQTGEEIPISTKLQSVLGTGIVAGSLEYVPIFAIFGKAGAKTLVGRVLSGMALEGTTEGAQGLVANAFAKAGYDADRNMVDGVVESIVGGVLLGGGMGAVSRVTNFKERVDETNPDEVSDILEQVESETEVTPERAVELTEAEKRQATIDREFAARRTPEERQAEIEAALPATPMTTISEETTKLAEEGIKPEVVEPVPEEIVPEEIPFVPEAMPTPLRAMGMRPAPVEPVVEKPAVPFMITSATETELADLGYTKKDISRMTPEDALGIVEGRIAKKPIIGEVEKVVEPEVEIPVLADTTQAIVFGEKATPEQITELKRLRKESEVRYAELTEEGKLDEAGKEALNAQLYREALEAKEKPKEPKVEKPEVVKKEPWEMTIAEARKKLKPKYASRDATNIYYEAEYLGQERYSYSPIDDFHRRIVKTAMRKGKPVPKEVLAEYPDLAPAKPLPTKPPEPTPPEVVREEIEAEPIPEVAPKVEKVEAPPEKIPPKPEPGKAWIKGKQTAILSAREITKDKNKGKYEVILTKGRDAEGNIIPGAKKIVTEKEIITMPEAIVEEKIKVAPIEKVKAIKPVIPGVKLKVEILPKKEYFMTDREGNVIKVKGTPIKIKGFEKYDIFYFKKDGEFRITEATTGTLIVSDSTLKGAKQKADKALKGNKDRLDKIITETKERIEKAKVNIKVSTTEILKGERGSFSTKTKEGAATFEDFSIVGKDFIKRGADTFTKFTEQMKKTFGEVWESVKHLAKELYTRAKSILTEERGEITIREEVPKIEKPIEAEPKVKKQFMEEAFKVLGIKPKLKPEEPLPKRARSVGLAYQNISEEAKRLEVEMGLEYPKITVTHKEIDEQADRIMGNQEQLIKTLAKEENWSKEEGEVVRRAASTGLESLMKVVATKDIEKANKEYKIFKEGIGKKLQDLHSEYGRNLESLKKKVSPESVAKAFTGLERDLNKEDMDKFNSAAEALGQGDAKPMINFQKHLKATKQDPKLMDYVYEYWYNSILSGVPTHVVNIASNTAWGAWQVGVHKPLLAAIDPLIAKFQKRPTEYYMAEIIPALAGIKRGFKPGIKGAKEVLVKGYTTDAELDKFAADMGKSVGAFSRSPNKYLRAIAPFLTMPTRALRGMDIWAKQMNYEAELGSVAKRMEKKGEGKYEELLKNPTEGMMQEASQYADYTTFMEKLGKIGTMIEKLRTAVPGGRFIMPFVRTIANLVKRGVEMTPGVGAMKLLGGKVKGKEVTQVLAKQVEGAMIALVVASMFDDDEITGDAPANKAEREAFYRQGKKPWSIKIGDTWYQYRRIEPFNTPIAAVGILHDTWKRTGEEPSTEFVYRSAAGFVNNIIDSSYLSGLTQVLDSVRKADKWPQKLTNMFDRTIASFSPMSSFQRSFVRAIEATDKEGAILRKPKGAIETLAAATPFMSEMVPARKDVWGEEIVIEGSPLEQWLPWKAAKVTKDIVEKEIERLHGLGLLSYPGMPAKYMSVAGKRLDLDDEQYDKLITESGQASKKKLDSLVDTSYWKMLSDKEKASRIQRIIKSDRKKARSAIKRGLGVGAIPGMVPWKTAKKRKRPAWQEPVSGKKLGWQKTIGF